MKPSFATVLTAMWACASPDIAAAVPPTLAIHLTETPDAKNIVLSFDKPTGNHYFVEHGDDLRQWTFVSRFWPGDGTPEDMPVPMHAGRRFFRLSAHPVPAEEWVTAPANTARAEYRIFWSEAARRPVSFHIYLPEAYVTEPDRRFPVLYWLHGSGAGTEGIGPLCQLFGNAMDTGKIPPMIVVFPNGLPHGMWCDSKDGTTPMETILIRSAKPLATGRATGRLAARRSLHKNHRGNRGLDAR